MLQWRLAGSKTARPDGVLVVRDLMAVDPSTKQGWFLLKTHEKTMTLLASSPEVCTQWVTGLRRLIR
jgi:hypothetical protein